MLQFEWIHQSILISKMQSTCTYQISRWNNGSRSYEVINKWEIYVTSDAIIDWVLKPDYPRTQTQQNKWTYKEVQVLQQRQKVLNFITKCDTDTQACVGDRNRPWLVLNNVWVWHPLWPFCKLCWRMRENWGWQRPPVLNMLPLLIWMWRPVTCCMCRDSKSPRQKASPLSFAKLVE